MILTFFLFFIGLSLALIALGLFRSEHTELTLIGFVFLFLLSLVILFSNITYKVGEQTNTSFFYTVNATINYTVENKVDIYTPFTDTNTHNFGYWLAVLSVVGFIGSLLGLRGNKRFE